MNGKQVNFDVYSYIFVNSSLPDDLDDSIIELWDLNHCLV